MIRRRMPEWSGSKGLVEASAVGGFGLLPKAISLGGAATLFDVSDWIARRSAIPVKTLCNRNAVRCDSSELVERSQSIENRGLGSDKPSSPLRCIYPCRNPIFHNPRGIMVASVGLT